MTLIDGDKLADSIKDRLCDHLYCWDCSMQREDGGCKVEKWLDDAPSIDIVRCQDCKKSHIDGKTTHYLWCVEWGRSTDVFGYCERGEREGE